MQRAASERAARGVRGRQHSQLSLPHDSHTTHALRSSLPRLNVPPELLGSESAAGEGRGSSSPDSASGRRAFFTQGSSARGRRSSSLILRQGSASAAAGEGARRARGEAGDASGDERALRVDGCEGDGAGRARGRSECERARGVRARLAGVTSLSERRWMRRRTPAGESASITFMLMLCAMAMGLFGSPDRTSLLSIFLSFSLCM